MDNKITAFALNFEKEGTALYLELARKAVSPLSKKLFYTLAGQEVEHARRIDEFYSGLSSGVNAVSMQANTVEEEIRKVFEGVKNSYSSEDNLDGYKTAMELEKRGYEAYRKFYEAAEEESEKKFLEFLLAEEKHHLDSIANVYSFFSGTSDWLEREESHTWNWMNI